MQFARYCIRCSAKHRPYRCTKASLQDARLDSLFPQLQEPSEGAQKRRRKLVRNSPELVTCKLASVELVFRLYSYPAREFGVPGVTSVWGNTPAKATWTLVDIGVTSQGQG